MPNPPEKTKDQILDDYIMEYCGYPGCMSDEMRETVRKSHRFASYKIQYYQDRLIVSLSETLLGKFFTNIINRIK